MSDLWPTVTTDPELDGLKNRTNDLLRGVQVIAGRHGNPAEPIEHVQDGSLPVFFLGSDVVLKLYPPRDREGFDIEVRTLTVLKDKVAAPSIIATGNLEGWDYLIMTRLSGQSLASAWDEIAKSDRLRLAESIGAWLADLHALSVDDIDLEHSVGPWPQFLEHQYAVSREQQARFGLATPWLEQVDSFLASVDLAIDGKGVLNHTEVMREHIFVDQRAGAWELVGLLDFEPAMIAPPEYELASVGVFTSCGEPEFLRRLLRTLGYAEADLDHELQRRCLAYALLHRYTCLPWYLRRMPPEAGVNTLDQLAAQWWRFR